jgi:predicted nuclease of predicted toxin-antitoxin system
VILWIDAQLPPAIAAWIAVTYGISAVAVRDIGLRDATDVAIFRAAAAAGAVVVTKDRDFVDLMQRLGSPPQLIWIRCGNTSNRRLREILAATLQDAFNLLRAGESLIEISDQ